MKIDPKWSFVWGIVTTALAFLTATGLPAFIDPHINEIVKQSSAWLGGFTGAITTYCAGFSSSESGPLVKSDAPK